MKDTIENFTASKSLLDGAIDKSNGNLFTRLIAFITAMALPSVFFVGLIFSVINLADADYLKQSKTAITQAEINTLKLKADMVKACLSESKDKGSSVDFYCDKADKAFSQVALIPVEKEILKEKAYKAMLYNFDFKIRAKENELKQSSSGVFSYNNMTKALVNEFTFSAVMVLTFLLGFYVLYRQGRSTSHKVEEATIIDANEVSTKNDEESHVETAEQVLVSAPVSKST